MCYHVKFGNSASKGVCVNRKEPPKLESTGAPPTCWRGVADPHKYATPHMFYSAEFGHSMSNGTSVIKEILLNLTPRVPPFKVTQGHQNRYRSILHLWLTLLTLLTFRSNHAISEINGDFSRKSQIFSTPGVYCAPTEGVQLELRTVTRGQKKEWGYRAEKEVSRYLQPSGYNTRKWRPDGHTPDDNKDRANA